MEKLYYDVCIIGGGASGIAAAVNIKDINPALSVLVLEGKERILKKLLTTGNGRCNITNKNLSVSAYTTASPDFCRSVLERYPVSFTENFFNGIGVPIVYEESGKAYPASYQASSVVDALRFAAEDREVDVLCDCKVTDIRKNGDLFTAFSENTVVSSRAVILSAGLYSGGDKSGSDGQGFDILKSKGISAEKTYPAIVQLKTENSVCRRLKGIKINALASLKADGKVLRKEYGEVLFCDYGLSGPPILQLSLLAVKNKGRAEISLNLFPDKTANELTEILKDRRRIFARRPAKQLFTGFINRVLGETVISLCGIDMNGESGNIPDEKLGELAFRLQNFEFKVTGDNGYLNSQVTAGGISTAELEKDTLELKKIPGLYLTGEIIDVTGDCGGYNLQWAWSTAGCVADAVTDKLK